MFINVHSHKPASNGEWVIQNLSRDFEQANNTGLISIGLHPWYINSNWQNEMEALRQWRANTHVLAIGECGLDRLCNTDYALQQAAFTAQVQWANTIGKPLVIHCVRAWEEAFQTLDKHHNTVPVIFHGFNRNKKLAENIIGKGYYLSFGKALQQRQLQHILRQLPPGQFFLETDDAPVTIQSIYAIAAIALDIDMNSLSLQLQKNAESVFDAAALTL